MSWTRRQFLGATAAGLVLPSVARAATPKRLVVVMADGGWDVTFAFDPKFHTDLTEGPEVDEDPSDPLDREDIRTFSGIPIAVNDRKRPAVTTFFENWSSQTAVVNGIWMGAIAHASSRVRVLTGTQTQVNPAWATIAGKELGADLPLGSVDLSAASYSGGLAASMGQIGHQAQIKALMVEGAAFPSLSGEPAPFTMNVDDREAMFAHLQARNEQFSKGTGAEGPFLEARQESLLRAKRFREQGAETIENLTLGAAPSLNMQANVAVDLLAGNLCRAVTLDSRRIWDTHDANDMQHDSYQGLFEGVDYLVGLLSERGLLDDTLVVVLSEFTRSPLRNTRGGKDHWPHASLILVGGGVHGGQVFGATDDRVESLAIDLATGEPTASGSLNKYDNLAAGLLSALDIDPEPWYPTIPPFTAPFA